DLSATADANGDMSVAGIAPGTYELAVKYPNSLQKVQVITIAAGNNTASVGELLMGDSNNDNIISILDFSILSFSFNATPSSQFYDLSSDYNGDSLVNALDFSLLAFNFSLSGEEPSN
ncbi:MAG: dockerin type I domain-containing protein, partial [Bacteroidota bacterium]